MERERPMGERAFRPTLKGCVAENRSMARALEEAHRMAFCAVANHTWRSLIFESSNVELSVLFDELATEQLFAFRLLGALIIALGGSPRLQGRLRGATDSDPISEGVLSDAMREVRVEVRCLARLMEMSDDRIVRTVLKRILDDMTRQLKRLEEIRV